MGERGNRANDARTRTAEMMGGDPLAESTEAKAGTDPSLHSENRESSRNGKDERDVAGGRFSNMATRPLAPPDEGSPTEESECAFVSTDPGWEPASDSPEASRFLGPYQLLEEIGRGGMGVVLKARDSKLGRLVAIKILRPELAKQSHYLQAFLSEARAMAAVRDPHVVAIHSVEDGRSPPYLVMEYIDGRSLADLLREGRRFSLDEILQIGIELARALEAIHARGILHRDIKPSNVLIEESTGCVKVTDFGVAVSASRTEDLPPAGTLNYMAPEQFERGPIDARSDLFSLGCVLHAMLHGAPPSTGGATPIAHVSENGSLERERQARLQRLVDSLIAESPEDRPNSAREVREQLEGLLRASRPDHVPSEVRSLSISTRVLGLVSFVAAIALAVWFFPYRWESRVSRPTAHGQPASLVVTQGRQIIVSFDLFQKDAPKPYSVNRAVIVTEPEGIRYWRPSVSGEWGEVVYRFEFPRPIESATLSCWLAVWQKYDPEARAELYLSTDGQRWQKMVELRDVYPDATHFGPISVDSVLRGSRTVYVKARLKAHDRGRSHAGMPLGPAFAQFLRCDRDGNYGRVFRLAVTLEADDGGFPTR